jgi:methionyl-tRNA formyltransferase
VTEPIRATDTTGDLLARLAVSGAALLVATMDGIEDRTLIARPQSEEGVSFASKVTVGDALVDWSAPALRVDRLVRACTPEPGAWTTFRGQRLKLGPVRPRTASTLPVAHLRAERNAVLVGTATGDVELGRVQTQGKQMMPAPDWARGSRIQPGERLG